MTRAGAALAVALLAAPAAATTLTAAPQPYVEARIKDVAVRARVSLGFDRALLLGDAVASRAKLRIFPIFGKRTVNSPWLPGGRATFRGNFYRVDVLGDRRNTPVGWLEQRVADDAEGIISVFAVPGERVTITRPGVPAGRAYTVTRDGESDAQSTVTLAGERIRVSLDLATPRTIMSARAAAALEAAGLAKRSGLPGLWEPVPGLRLPYERMRATPGATVAGLPLVEPAVRVTRERLAELDARLKAGAAPDADDGDTIVVTARGQQRGRAWMIIGADVLNRCGRIELDRPGRRWLLDCAF